MVVGLAGALASWGFGCGGDVPSDAANRGNLGAFNNSTSASTDQTGTGGMAGGTGGLVAYSTPDVSQSSTGGLDTTMATGGVPDAPDGETTCGGVEVTPMVETVVIPGNVLVVFDESLSMNEQWGNGQTKWVAASQAVISALTPLQDQISAGTLFFPTGGGFLGCDVAAIKSSPQIDFMPGPQFITAWNSYMASHGPSGHR